MSTTCRICLSDSKSTTELTEYREGLPISVLVMIILPVKIYECDDSNLPQVVCNSCLDTILCAYKLRDISIASERTLREAVEDLSVKKEGTKSKLTFAEAPNPKKTFLEPAKPKEVKILKNSPRKSAKPTIVEVESDDDFADEDSTVADEPDTVDSLEGMTIDCYRKNKTLRKSIVWQYFGKLRNQSNKHVDAAYHYCNLCLKREVMSKYKTTSATSTLIFHLNTVHGIDNGDAAPDPEYFKEKRKEKTVKVPPPAVPKVVEATVCDECGKSFGNHHVLKKHMKIHSGQFYNCDR